jgi:serine protease
LSKHHHLIATAISVALGLSALLPVSAQSTEPSTVPTGPSTSRLIVKFRAPDVHFDRPDAEPGIRRAAAMTERRLAAQAGRGLSFVREMSGGAQVYALDETVDTATAAEIAARLSALPDVEYAIPSYRRFPSFVPNDSLLGSQWALEDPIFAYGVDAFNAWDIQQGSASLFIAVLDTGVRFDHPDLAGRLTPGYDMIDDVPTANDGNGRDPNASDPGDWITVSENASGPYKDCLKPGQSSDSSWHGTHVAGIIGAAGNNAIGVSGLNLVSKIVPVRVLGKCGGFDDDIVDGMRWAGGLPVPGVPANPNPARIINLSLGGSQDPLNPGCPALYADAIAELRQRVGAIVVVAAGNDNRNASNDVPANCSGAVTVAANTRSGSKANYSNFGSLVDITAPGGVSGDAILSTLNAGSTTPVAYSSSGHYEAYCGTSMATPYAAAVMSLIWSHAPWLSAESVINIMRNTATPFPSGSSCSVSSCGPGIANAYQALLAADALTSPARRVVMPQVRRGQRPSGSKKLYSPARIEPQNVSMFDPCRPRRNRVYAPFTTRAGGIGDPLPVIGLANPGFEDGIFGWQIATSNGFKQIYSATDPEWVADLSNPLISPQSGSRAVWFRSCVGVDEDGAVSQLVRVPAGQPRLTYYSMIRSREGVCDFNRDAAVVRIDTAAVESRPLCTVTSTDLNAPTWEKRTIDVSTYAGQTVLLTFEFQADFEQSSEWLIDSIAFE